MTRKRLISIIRITLKEVDAPYDKKEDALKKLIKPYSTYQDIKDIFNNPKFQHLKKKANKKRRIRRRLERKEREKKELIIVRKFNNKMDKRRWLLFGTVKHRGYW